MRASRAIWAVPIVLAVVLVVALGTVLAHSEPRMTGTNSVPLRMQKIGLQRAQEVCQGSQLLPAGSGRMRMFIKPGDLGGAPRAIMTVRHPLDGLVARSTGRWLPAGKGAGTSGISEPAMDFAIDPPVRNTRTDAYVCVRNVGRRPIVLTGVLTPFGNTILGPEHLDIALTTLWFAPEDKTWFQELGSIVPRVGYARVGGTWAFWVAGLLLLAALGTGLALTIRENTR